MFASILNSIGPSVVSPQKLSEKSPLIPRLVVTAENKPSSWAVTQYMAALVPVITAILMDTFQGKTALSPIRFLPMLQARDAPRKTVVSTFLSCIESGQGFVNECPFFTQDELYRLVREVVSSYRMEDVPQTLTKVVMQRVQDILCHCIHCEAILVVSNFFGDQLSQQYRRRDGSHSSVALDKIARWVDHYGPKWLLWLNEHFSIAVSESQLNAFIESIRYAKDKPIQSIASPVIDYIYGLDFLISVKNKQYRTMARTLGNYVTKEFVSFLGLEKQSELVRELNDKIAHDAELFWAFIICQNLECIGQTFQASARSIFANEEMAKYMAQMTVTHFPSNIYMPSVYYKNFVQTVQQKRTVHFDLDQLEKNLKATIATIQL